MADADKETAAVVVGTSSAVGIWPNVSDDVLKALHRSAVGTKEFTENSVRESRIVELPAVTQLIEMLDQWTSPFDVASRQYRFVVQHAPYGDDFSQRINLPDFESLKKIDQSSPSPAKSIEIYLSVIIRNRQTGNKENYNLTIELIGYVLSASRRNIMYGVNEHSLRYTIEYSDYLIAKNLATAVTNWYSALPLHELPSHNPISRFLTRRKTLSERGHSSRYDLAKYGLSLFLVLSVYLISCGLQAYAPLAEHTVDYIFAYASLFVIAIFVLNKFEEKYFESILYEDSYPILLLNEGNRRNHSILHSEIAKQQKSLSKFILSTLWSIFIGALSGLALLLLPMQL